MSIGKINQQIEKLKHLHVSLLQLTKEQTVVLKSGDTDKLQQMLPKERKLLQAIEKAENDRLEAVSEWYRQKNIGEESPQASRLLEILEDSEEKNILQKNLEEMTSLIFAIKGQQQLNAELTKQSLQFIHLSLDMLQPDINQMNYGRKTEISRGENRSIFDSKA
ncbi:hypothetical protein GCM10007216_12000 [Thalassobacillus devorans]|uniref:FlgN protein n=1 Tax=Thalassobacillus devorans TaxID=279813 RepID=A0ABQ1NQT6_9BACI|nr:flagellar protein FlgN [Thalassobacillus devorans]NIK28860.1 hypothetical protein [Thalassobacillus devorans]GGC83030.1 hypothetical protein GCM10007216_12000 [Thalassobacillus devorans]